MKPNKELIKLINEFLKELELIRIKIAYCKNDDIENVIEKYESTIGIDNCDYEVDKEIIQEIIESE